MTLSMHNRSFILPVFVPVFALTIVIGSWAGLGHWSSRLIENAMDASAAVPSRMIDNPSEPRVADYAAIWTAAWEPYQAPPPETLDTPPQPQQKPVPMSPPLNARLVGVVTAGSQRRAVFHTDHGVTVVAAGDAVGNAVVVRVDPLLATLKRNGQSLDFTLRPLP